jgi:hypothetical protein
MSAPSLAITVEPQQGGSVVYNSLAAPSAGAAASAQLSLVLRITNGESVPVHVNKVTLAFSSPPSVAPKSIGADVSLAAGASTVWYHGPADNVLLPLPAPGSLTIGLQCDGYADAATVTVSLAAFISSLPGGAYTFPTGFQDGEYWSGRSAAHSAAGGGVQLFGYDMAVVRYDEASKAWSELVPGGSPAKNEDYLIWGKPIVAMADGTVQSWLDGQPTNPNPPQDLSPPGPVEGNHFYIQHQEALVLYAHLQAGSLNPNLLTAGATVRAGDVLGLAGNSGNSSNPHLHIHAIRGTMPWQGPPWPISFRGVRTIDRSLYVPPDPAAPWVGVDGSGLPPVAAAIAPLRPRRHQFYEVAIDPLALILPSEVYIKLTLPDPPPIDIVIERARRAIASMSPEAREQLRVRLNRIHQAADAIARELEKSST